MRSLKDLALVLVLALVCVPVLASANDSADSVRGWISDVKCGAKGASASH